MATPTWAAPAAPGPTTSWPFGFLTGAAVVGATLLRGWVLLGAEPDGGALVAVGAAASGSPSAGSLIELFVGRAAASAAPLEFWPLALALLVLWLGYCGSAFLAARALTRQPSHQLVLLVAMLFAAASLPGMATWPEGVVQSTLAIGFLLATAGAARWLNTGRIWEMWPILLGAIIALLGSPHSPWAPGFLVVAWAAALLFVPGVTLPQAAVAPAAVRGRRGWGIRGVATAILLLTACAWAVLTGGRPLGELPRDLGRLSGYVGEAFGTGLLPGAVGGPLSWVVGFGPWPASEPPVWIVVAGVQAVLVGLAASVFLTGRGLLPWGVPVAFIALSLTWFVLGSPPAQTGTGDQLLGLAVAPALLAVAVASTWEGPGRRRVPWPDSVTAWITPSRSRLVGLILVDAFIALSVTSIVAWSYARPPYPGADYLAQARDALATAPRDVPLLPQVVPAGYVDPGYAPLNTTDVVFAPLAERPEFLPWTSQLQGFDESGRLLPGVVEGVEVPVECAFWAPDFLITPTLPDFTYVAEITLAQPSLTGFAVRLGDGPSVSIPPSSTLTTVYAQISGSGNVIGFTPLGDAPVCLEKLVIGQAVLDEDPSTESSP